MPARTPPDAATFDDRYAGLSSLAYRVAFRILGERGDAEDVAQETMARAFVRWRKVDGFAEPWVARVATNAALGIVRRRGRSHPSAPLARPGIDSDRVALVAALRKLPKRQREVLVLRYLADMTEDAVAAQLGISTGSVKQHAHRALRAARPLLDPEPAAAARATPALNEGNA